MPMTPSGIEPATFWLVEQCLKQLRYRVPPRELVGLFICLAVRRMPYIGLHVTSCHSRLKILEL